MTDGQVLWHTAEDFGGATSAPGLTTVVVQTWNPRRKKTTTRIIDALGQAKTLDVDGHLLSGG